MSGLFEQEPPQVRPLRDYQVDALEKLRASLASGHRRPLLQAPTGYGKTRVASEIIARALAKGKRVVFTIPALSLIDQTLEAFHRDGIRDMGVIQADHFETDWARPVQVASVQTLMRRPLPQADIVLIDEAHKWFEFYGKWMSDEAFVRVPFIGLSATPWTKGLGNWYDDLIISATTGDLIDKGFLSPFRAFSPAHPDLKGVRTIAGDYHEGDLSVAMDKDELIADVVQTWIKLGDGRPTLCYGVDRAHAGHLHDRFIAAGIPSAYIDFQTDMSERAIIRDKFKRGEVKVVCNIATMIMGVDWDVRCIIFARPTKSPTLFVQVIGRGLRTAVGKKDLLILDHANNHARFGFVTDIHREFLNDALHDEKKESRETKEPMPKECPKCAYLRPPKVAACPNCGFVPERLNKVQEREGELLEISATGVQKKRLERPGFVKMQSVFVPLADFYGMLKRQARERGYKPGWASNQYREAVGVWPNRYKDVPEKPISYEVQSWIRSRQIRYAKARKTTVHHAEV